MTRREVRTSRLGLRGIVAAAASTSVVFGLLVVLPAGTSQGATAGSAITLPITTSSSTTTTVAPPPPCQECDLAYEADGATNLSHRLDVYYATRTANTLRAAVLLVRRAMARSSSTELRRRLPRCRRSTHLHLPPMPRQPV